MGAHAMVVLTPRLDGVPSIGQTEEPLPVEAFVAESSWKAFDEGVLDRLARLDEAQDHSLLIRPLINNFARQLWTVVQDDLVGSPAGSHQPF